MEEDLVTCLRNFRNEDRGQDLIEYALLMTFVALASAARFLGVGGGIRGIWPQTAGNPASANSGAG